ncbi:citryl-CoA lyase [Aureimonas endophytica]|uniref:Citryl-CoA lyase n=1 Tax=Aureimonas endophytica TaxID=2027858 RepID=A0A917A1W7_9HYPH|nr:aldolase/citrate lyase family protein [Aureimonas endophytica]GGE22625.1 citryl-CoA lyase [Aureimonas endophytica]
MPSAIDNAALFLFVPADRPERFAKAFAAGAEAVIVDLEDAVAPGAKDGARAGLADAGAMVASAPCPVLLRVNPVGAAGHAADLALAAELPFAALVLPKAEGADEVEAARRATGRPVVALVESAKGIANARALAGAAGRLAFGSFDFAADLGCRHEREALLLARLELVLASRLAGRAGPVDGVTAAVRDEAAIRGDAAYAAGLGFAGKLLIHPAQIAPARAGFGPGAEEIAWATRVLAAGRAGGAVALDGEMVDAPVRLRAETLLRRAGGGAA